MTHSRKSVGKAIDRLGFRRQWLSRHGAPPRFSGVEGSAYLIGGVGVNFQKHGHSPRPIGVGARLGANVGYLKYSRKPSEIPSKPRNGPIFAVNSPEQFNRDISK